MQAGEEVGGIDIHYRGERGHAISGKLVGIAADSANLNTNLQLFSLTARAAEEATYVSTSFARNENSFVFYGTADGDYLIAAYTYRADGKLSGGGRGRVKVRGADATGVEITVTPYGSIAGTLVVEPPRNIDPQNKCESKRLTPDEMMVRARREKPAAELELNMGFLYQNEPSDKGAFTLASLEPASTRSRR